MPNHLRPLRPFAGHPPFTIDIWITDEDADVGKVSREGAKVAKAVLIHVHADAFEIIECPPNPSGIARPRARPRAQQCQELGLNRKRGFSLTKRKASDCLLVKLETAG